MKTMKLPVRLTEAELLERGQRLVTIRDEVETAERALSRAKQEHKNAVDELDIEQTEILCQLREGAAWRDVGVEVEKDFEAKVERTVRLDTGEIVSTCPLDPSELQGELLEIVPPSAATKRSPRTKEAVRE